MGAWGIHTFEDDQNLDWLDDLIEQERPLEFFRECLDLDGIDELEYMACTGVLCSAVLIDGLLNGRTRDLPETAVQWLEQHAKLKVERLVPSAIQGIERLLEPTSEMTELWKSNTELYSKWRRRVVALKNRLAKSRPPKAKKSPPA